MEAIPAVNRTLPVAILTLLSVGCGSESRQAPPRYPPYPSAGAQAPSPNSEGFQPGAPGQVASTLLYLPGNQRQQMVSFRVVDGVAVMEGDIQLGSVNTLAARYGRPPAQPYAYQKGAITTSYKGHLWPNGVIPYSIDSSVPPDQVDNIGKAIVMVNKTELEVRPRTTLDKDYVVFSTAKGGCSSSVGRVGGGQDIQVGTCGPGSIAHEILHAAGFYHEQSRSDRDAFITIMWDEIEPEYKFAFEKHNERDIGSYDYASVMHYDARAFSRTGKPTIIPRVPNAPIGQRQDLSSGDKAAITALYGGGGGGLPELPGGFTLPFPIPNMPTAPSTSDCAAGQVRDVLFQTCSLPCANGSAPIAGACAPGASGGGGGSAPPPVTPAVPSGCATPADLLSGKCFPPTT